MHCVVSRVKIRGETRISMGFESSRKVAIIIMEINNAFGLCNSWIVFQRAFYDLEIIRNRIQNEKHLSS